MIIWGYKGYTKEISHGHFFCPFCECGREYRHFRITRNFTLFFVPLFPIKKFGEIIECQGCFTPFEPEVLDHQHSVIKNNISREELISLWKEFYDAIGCEKFIGTRLDSPLMRTAVSNFKGAGAHLAAGDYTKAREYLKYLMFCCEEWAKTRKDLEELKETDWFLSSEKIYSQFLIAVRTILKDVP